MLFNVNTLTLVGVLAGSALAQTPEQIANFGKDLTNYIEGLTTDPAYLSAASALATDTAAQSSFAAAIQSLESVVLAGSTLPATFVEALPTAIQGVVSSILAAESSIASANGITSDATAPATLPGASATALPTPTGSSSSSSSSSTQLGTSPAQTTSAPSTTPTGQFTNSTASTSKNPSPSSSSPSANAAQATGGMLGAGIVAGVVGAAAMFL